MASKPLIDPAIRLDGKTAVVTGANTGIGKVTALELARAGAQVVLACRTESRAQAAMDEIRAEVPDATLLFSALELSSLKSVRACVADLQTRTPAIDILVNNAGIAGTRKLTEDGFEFTFGVNHIGHAALTSGLRENLVDGGRVVFVASRAHAKTDVFDLDGVHKVAETVVGMSEYAVSKLANILYARKLSHELADKNIDVYALHPGVVATDIWRRVPWPIRVIMKWFMLSNEDGARTQIHCAASAEAKGMTGLYWDKSAPKTPTAMAQDDALMNDLWTRTQAWIA